MKQVREKQLPYAFTHMWNLRTRGACMAQLVKHSISAQVMILWVVGLSPTLGSVLTAQSLESALGSVSASLLLMLCLSLSLKNKYM